MEFWLFLGLVFVGPIFYLWRSRRRTSGGVDSLTKGLPDDLRNKQTIENTRGALHGPYGGTGGFGGFDGGGN
jgi:hypothetical protein